MDRPALLTDLLCGAWEIKKHYEQTLLSAQRHLTEVLMWATQLSVWNGRGLSAWESFPVGSRFCFCPPFPWSLHPVTSWSFHFSWAGRWVFHSQRAPWGLAQGVSYILQSSYLKWDHPKTYIQLSWKSILFVCYGNRQKLKFSRRKRHISIFLVLFCVISFCTRAMP